MDASLCGVVVEIPLWSIWMSTSGHDLVQGQCLMEVLLGRLPLKCNGGAQRSPSAWLEIRCLSVTHKGSFDWRLAGRAGTKSRD